MAIQWSLVLFTVISGAGAWLFACAGLAELKAPAKKAAFAMAILAVVLMAVGGICSVTHLSHPERVLGALAHPAPGIFLEALLLGITAVVAIIYAVLVKREAGAGVRKVLGIVGFILAIAFTFSCGSSYMMASHPMWNTVALPLAYMGTAAASGTALFLLIASAMHEEVETVKLAGILTMAGGALALVLGIVYGFAGGVAMGSQAALFWIGVVVCGGIAPLVCGIAATKKADNALALGAVAFVGGLIGSGALRCLMWLVGAALMSLFGVSI